MDCQKLYKDIERLKSLRDELSAKLEVSAESGLGKTALSSLSHEASEILEYYAEDIIEQNINDPSSRNSEFLDPILERYWQEDQSDQPESENNSESLITPDTTIDQVRNNLSEYLKADKRLDSNLLTYVLKEKLGLLSDNSTNGQNLNLKELEELCKDFLPDRTLPKLVYLHKIAERVKNLETLETENYIFMLPKDKWNEGKIKLPNPENNSDTPEYIAPNDLTAILKEPVYYDWSYETDRQRTEFDGNARALVYDEKWVGKEIHHFPWSKELIKEANENLLKPSGYHIPEKKEWVDIYDNLRAKYGDDDEAISQALREDFNLTFSGGVEENEPRHVGQLGGFWSITESLDDAAYCLMLNSINVVPEVELIRILSITVRCVSNN